MKSSIQWKIVSIYLCVVLIIMMVCGSFIVYNIEDKQYKSMQEDMSRIARQIEETLGIEKGFNLDDNIEDIEGRLKKIVALNPCAIYVLDATAHVQLSTDDDFKIGQIVDSEIVANTRQIGKASTSSIPHFASRETEIKKIEHARPVYDAQTQEIISIIYISTDAREIIDNVTNVMTTLSIGVAMAMAIAAVFGVLFSRMITVPIKQLTKSAKQLAAGSFQRIPIYSTDELGQLTQSFNYMATELSRTMGDISSEKSKLEKILENMADGVMAFNRQGVLIHANSVCYDMLGSTNMDHRFDFIFPKLGVEVSFDHILAEEAKDDEGIMMMLEDKYFNLHFAPYTNVLGESEGLVVVMQDVTNQQKLEQMRKEFVANVSHELRTPLTTVKSYTETLLEGAIDDREVAVQFLTVMEKEADRMTTLVHDLLELSRIDNRQMQLEFRKVELKELVKDTMEAQKLQAAQKGHKLVLELQEDLEYAIKGDSARIRQVLHNILSNAIKYTIDPGTITLKLFKNEEIVVQVQDTGIGIPNQDLGRIFERFYRVDKARSRKMGGTGLGLSIAKEMVELHGGRIKIASKVGKGTIVTMYFKSYTEES